VASCSPNFLNGPPLPFPGNAQYKSLGCYTEATGGRALTGNHYASTTAMTAEACIAFCAGSKYVGVEYASECYCGSSMIPIFPTYYRTELMLVPSSRPKLRIGPCSSG
jgi:hypothetical protein